MVRFLINVGITLLANALGLLVAAVALDAVTITVPAFLVAVVIFTVCYAVAQPFIAQIAEQTAPALRGGVALLATLVALVITTLLTDDLSISGVLAWIEAAVIVWLVSLVGAWLLPAVLTRKRAEEKGA